MKNILYCAIHTINQKERVEWIRSTWGENQDVIFYGDYDDKDSNSFKVSDKNDYSSGQEKQIKIFDFLKTSFTDYEWYFFCDNDTFINTKKLNTDIQLFDKTKITCSRINHWPIDNTLYYPSGGAGFSIHRSLLKKICNLNFKIYPDLIFGDVSFGLNCRDHKIEFVNNDLFHGMDPNFYNLDKSQINNHYTFHYIKTFNAMKDLYDVCDR